MRTSAVRVLANFRGWRSSIQGRLLALIIAALIPVFAFSIFLAYRYAEAERQVIEARRRDVSNNLSFLVDGEVLAIRTTVSNLAKSPDLVRGDITSFRAYAMALVDDRISVLAVLEASGQQLMSTAIAAGDTLPKREDMSIFAAVFNGQVVVSDVVSGTAVKRPVVSIAAPVSRDGVVVYVLSAVVYPEHFSKLFADAEVNPDWAAAVIDRQGRFVVRNINPEQRIGAIARPELVSVARGPTDIGTFENITYEGVSTANSFRRSQLSGWTSVVSVPTAVLAGPLRRTLTWVVGIGFLMLLTGVTVAHLLARRISQSVESFSYAAALLLEGKPLPTTPLYINELTEVRSAFEHTYSVIVARNKADEQVKFLMQELAHRTRNLLAVIQSIASRSARDATSLNDFQRSFSSRLSALAVSNDVLIHQGQDGASLAALIRDHLAPFVDPESGRITVHCPDIILSQAAAQAVGMALHELATNASKYGSLSGASGTVTVTCNTADEEPGRPLRLTWIEAGGPPVMPPVRQGFGRVVMERMAAAAVNGRADLDYAPTGFRWTLLIARVHVRHDSTNG